MIRYDRLTPDELVTHVLAGIEEVEKLYLPLGRDQLNWRPAPGRWSIAQCLHHLVVTDALYLHRLRRRAEQARRKQLLNDGPYDGGAVGRWFTSHVGPRITMRMKAPPSIAPHESPAIRGDVVAAFIANERLLISLIDDSRGLDLNRARIGWPVAPFVRLRMIDAFRALVAHDRRHLDQARRVMADMT
jgi:hypothetical protein